MTNPLPPLIYKYLPAASYLPSVLSGDSLRFSSPLEFNDPFECQAITVIEKGAEGKRYLRDGVKGLGLSVADRIQKIKQLEGKQGKPMLPADFPLLSDLVRKIGVSCFSDERDNILMWAHYSDNHSGVCLGFNTSRHLFQTAWQVQYQEQLPVLNRPSDSHDTLLEKSLLTKSAQWGYEREWRIIRRTLTVDESSYLERKYAGASREQLEVALRQSGPGFYSFPKEAISEVCLGVKMTPDKKKTVIGWVKDAGLAVPIYEASRHPSEFRLEFEEACGR